MPLICAIVWLNYSNDLLKEQNENLSQLVLNLEAELKLAIKKPAPVCVPKIVELPCEIVYTSDSCDPCHCGDD